MHHLYPCAGRHRDGNFVRRERWLGRAGAGFWIDVSIIALAISVALLPT